MKKRYTLILVALFTQFSFGQTPNNLDWGDLKDNGSKDIEFKKANQFKQFVIDGLLLADVSQLKIGLDEPLMTQVEIGKYISDGFIDFSAFRLIYNKGNDWTKLSDTDVKITTAAKSTTLKIIAINKTGKPVSLALQVVKKGTPSDYEELNYSEKQARLNTHIRSNYGAFAGYYRDDKSNIIKTKNTVHIFVDEFGNTYFGGFPTTAREDYNYTLHVFYLEEGVNKKITGSFKGVFEPSFEVYGSAFLGKASDAASMNATGGDKIPVEVKELIFDNNGPYTGSFTVDVQKELYNEDGALEKTVTLVSKTVKVAKVHHISLTIGLIGSGLSNSSDVEKFGLPSGDTTLIANDPTTRGMITLMATFYPKPRNLLFPATSPAERIGFVVGTRIDKELTENFFGGISYDLARGLALTGGAHYGRINRVAGVGKDFEYGTETFTGKLEMKKEWDLGWYIGVNIDLRVFSLLFNPQGSVK